MNRQLEWYKYLVYNKSIIGSLFTLMHLPFMLAFLSLVIIGTAAFKVVDSTVLGLSLASVSLLLYGEHMLDDTTRAGKPWKTVFNDAALVSTSCFVFILALSTGIYANRILGSLFPGAAVGIGILFCTLYGLEFRNFHTIEFGALCMATIPVSSYLAQVLTLGLEANPIVIIGLGVFGFGYGYVLRAYFEWRDKRTKAKTKIKMMPHIPKINYNLLNFNVNIPYLLFPILTQPSAPPQGQALLLYLPDKLQRSL
ncbi:Uncharacterised protein [uncultured archaeon]|nr:Uncharacterised protein [uncultured archaeon]